MKPVAALFHHGCTDCEFLFVLRMIAFPKHIMCNQTVLISGAGIAGPALAYWLQRYGFAVTVVERAPTLREGGQAIDFKGHTQQTVLERMGMWEEICQRQSIRTDVVYLDAAGREVAVMTGEFIGSDIEILRGDLCEIF